MIDVRIKDHDIVIDEEKLSSMEVSMERRRGRGDRKWSLLLNYPDGAEEYMMFGSYREAAEALYMVSVIMEQEERRK